MKKQNKLLSVGLIAVIISLVFINGMVQINLMKDGSNLGSGGDNATFGNSDTQYTVIYGDPTELIVQKTESVTIDLFPNGSIKSQRVTVNFVFENEADENCTFDLIDRAEYCDLDTIKFQKGTFPSVIPYQVIKSDEDFGVTVLKWSNISVSARSRGEFGYAMISYKAVPIEVETEYWVNGSLVQIDPLRNEINTSVGSFVSNIIRVKNIQQGLYSSYDIAKPTTICLITLMLPYEEEEADRDIDEPIYSPEPIMSTDLLGIRQVSWIALGDEYEINWSTTVLKGGGWGIVELQPLRFDLVQSADLTGVLYDGLSGLLGLLAAQQAYWAVLGLMAMIEELMGMMGIFELLLNDIQTYLGMMSMASYSLINCLLITLIELDMTKTSLEEIYTQISAMYGDISSTFGPLDGITREFDRILGQGAYAIGVDLGTNGPIGTGIPYMSLPLLIDYYGDIERRIVGSFGAQLIELMGSPAFINMTSTEDDSYFIINATATPLPDNSTDFYTLIDVVNLTLPVPVVPLNLTRRYEFQLNVPLDRDIFEYIDAFFGEPSIPFDMFPYIPGSPGSNVPGFYTWMLDIMRVGKAALWATIGNLTRSLATLMLQLDSSFSEETLDLINAALSGGSINPSTPITLETGFTGISDLMGMFSGLEEQFSSPFGSPFSDIIPSTGSSGVPTSGVDMSLLDNFGFWTALKIYLDPVPRIRQLLNITIPLDFGNMTAGIDIGDIGGMSSMMGGIGFAKSVENGQMSDWDWNYTGLTSASVIQSNQLEDSTDFKRIQFQATGSVGSGNISLTRRLNYTVPAIWLDYRIRTDNTNPILSVVVVSRNATGDDVYATRIHNLSELTPNTWYEFSCDLRSTEYWEYIDESFDIENITGVELRITPQTTATVNLDIDFLEISREIIPYPYDILILDGYLIGDGVEILPNITTWDKWTDGLMITDLEISDMTADGVNDVIASSNDGHIYVINGSDGHQVWNYSADGNILDLFLEDIIGDSSPEIIFGTGTGKVGVINKTSGVISNFSIGSNLDYLLCGNLDGAGTCELVAVSDDNITAVDYYGNFLWNSTVKGSVRGIDVADLDGDGSEEIGVATYKYKIYVLNGTNGNSIWDYITEERPTHLVIGNLVGDAEKELIYSTDQDYCVVLEGMQGTHLANFTMDGVIRGIYIGNLTNNPYNDILIHTGLVTGQNLAAIAGDSLISLWNFTTPFGFNSIAVQDIISGNYDEVMVSAVDNRFYQLDSSGNVELNFTIPQSINTMTFDELSQPGVNEFIYGMGNNHILVLNGSNQQELWMTELGIDIITFQFIRTNETIQLLYNLADPFTDMLSTFGLSLTGTDDVASLAGFDLGMGGMEGMEGLDLGALNLTADALPLTGLGLVNMLEMEITIIAMLQDMKLIGSSQRAYTGVPEVRYVDKDIINCQLYPIISDATNTKYLQYKVRNFEEQPIRVHYFALNLTVNGQPLNESRVTIEGWNGTHFIDLGNNRIRNVTFEELGLTYMDGELLFEPYIEIEELEKPLITVDWLGRELRIKLDLTGINPNDLSIETWVDVSIELPGIEMQGVTSTISYSKTHPTFIVTSVPIPDIGGDEEAVNILQLMITSSAFWALVVIGFTTLFGFSYMKQREEKEVNKVASKKIVKWLKKRERSWLTLVKANVMTDSQYYTLKRIRYRVIQENLRAHPIEAAADKVLNWRLIGTFISTVSLRRFWRGVNKPSRLIWIINTVEQMVLSPLKRAWATFKTALGYMNPWDMDRQRRRELRKKAKKKIFWKKIEPPRKPIRKKRVEGIRTRPTAPIKVKPPIKKTKEDWTGEYRNDGGVLLKKISAAKKLPPLASRDGQVFYTISQRKFVGITLKELSKVLDLLEFEVLVSIVRLYEKGLIFLLQEGDTLSNDLWDVASSLRKYDSELEKMIDSADTLENEIEEGIDFLQTEIKNNSGSENTRD